MSYRQFTEMIQMEQTSDVNLRKKLQNKSQRQLLEKTIRRQTIVFGRNINLLMRPKNERLGSIEFVPQEFFGLAGWQKFLTHFTVDMFLGVVALMSVVLVTYTNDTWDASTVPRWIVLVQLLSQGVLFAETLMYIIPESTSQLSHGNSSFSHRHEVLARMDVSTVRNGHWSDHLHLVTVLSLGLSQSREYMVAMLYVCEICESIETTIAFPHLPFDRSDLLKHLPILC